MEPRDRTELEVSVSCRILVSFSANWNLLNQSDSIVNQILWMLGTVVSEIRLHP